MVGSRVESGCAAQMRTVRPFRAVLKMKNGGCFKPPSSGIEITSLICMITPKIMQSKVTLNQQEMLVEYYYTVIELKKATRLSKLCIKQCEL